MYPSAYPISLHSKNTHPIRHNIPTPPSSLSQPAIQPANGQVGDLGGFSKPQLCSTTLYNSSKSLQLPQSINCQQKVLAVCTSANRSLSLLIFSFVNACLTSSTGMISPLNDSSLLTISFVRPFGFASCSLLSKWVHCGRVRSSALVIGIKPPEL